MNKIIILYVKGTEYNKMLKWNNTEDFWNDINNNKNTPNSNDIITEAYVDDNLVDMGNTFAATLEKLKMILL